jgi:hypothetical protein
MLADAELIPAAFTGCGRDGSPERVTADPRRLVLAGILCSEFEEALLEHRCQLLRLHPEGPVIHDPGDSGGFQCPVGWTVTDVSSDLSPVLGPQAAQVLAVIAAAETVIRSGGGPSWDSYVDATDALGCGDAR